MRHIVPMANGGYFFLVDETDRYLDALFTRKDDAMNECKATYPHTWNGLNCTACQKQVKPKLMTRLKRWLLRLIKP